MSPVVSASHLRVAPHPVVARLVVVRLVVGLLVAASLVRPSGRFVNDLSL